MESRVKMFEELVAPLNEAVQNGIPIINSDKVFSSYNHIYMTMIASSLCNISDKLDILVEKMEKLDKEDKENMINVDLRRYGTDEEYKQFINGYLSGADIDETPVECQLVRSAKEATDEEIQEILGKKEEATE